MLTEAKEIYIQQYPEFAAIFDAHERAHWFADEADMTEDVEQWKSGIITDSNKAFIKMILRSFTQNDKDVNDAYYDKLIPVFKNPDVRMMLGSFANREATHIKAYKRLNDTLGYDSLEFMSEFLEYQAMKDNHEFMIDKADLKSEAGKAEYLAKQVLMEGVILFASFAMLLSSSQINKDATGSKNGKLPGMVSVNKWSQVDETWHVMGLTCLFKQHVAEHPRCVTEVMKKVIYQTARDIVRLSDSFVELCFSAGSNDVLTESQVKQYVRYVCDYRMQQMGFKAQFDISENPIEWMDKITGNTFGNFFESTITEYSKGNLTGEWVY